MDVDVLIKLPEINTIKLLRLIFTFLLTNFLPIKWFSVMSDKEFL